jgi:hypothetical protein
MTMPVPAPGPVQPPAAVEAPADVEAEPRYQVGGLYLYEYEAHLPTPHKRVQLVVVTEVTPEGYARGLVLGHADDGAQFAPGQLDPLGT